MNSEHELFRSIYLRYTPALRKLAGSMGIPVDDWDDLIQETFAKYFDHYSVEWSELQIKGMLIKIFRNRYVDYLRRQSCRPVTYVDPVQLESGEVSSAYSEENDPQNMILEAQEHQEIMDALNKMKPEWSEIIKKLVIEERPVEEVSEELGISKEACRTRLSRARKELRKMMNRDVGGRKKPDKKTLEREDEITARGPDSPGIPGSA